MTGANRGKVAAVGGEYFCGVESLGGRNHRRIHETQIEIGVFPDEGLGSRYVLPLEGFNNKLPVRNRAQECSFSLL